jgi:p-aminobenzoyl-glutamate transporter AbgT
MSLLLPFGAAYMVLQVAMLLFWWTLGLDLGIGGRYTYP